jgi:hydroxyacylglutathione hydrolase
MGLTVHQFPCLSDNYGFLVRDDATGETACIDTPDAAAILREVKKTGWRLTRIFNTHWHPDHAGGNAEVQAATGAVIYGPGEVRRAGPLDHEVGDGDVVVLGETRFEVLATGGHTLGHITYHAPAEGIAFVGDTMFTMGCGRLFEGTPEQMWTSLSKIAALPADTRVYSAHEYTLANARFALSVDDDAAVKARADAVTEKRERGEWTVPTTIAEERATNPFLRAPGLAIAAGAAAPAEAFARVRAAKDGFKG